MGKLMPFNDNIDPKHIIKTKFSDSGKDVCWYFYKGKKLRMRAEVLLVDEDGKMYAHIKEKAWNAHACGYALPGGGLEHDDKDYSKCAAREAQEEARITPSPCIDTGIRYWVQYSNPENADNSPGALSILCIGKVGKRYTGYIAPEDRDSMLKGGDWYYPNDLPGFHKYHKQAYDMALKKFGIKKPVKEWLDGYVDQIVEYVKQ
jgi:8-oxo-dGTP pyrophosphatase MutT (NUDIX family)